MLHLLQCIIITIEFQAKLREKNRIKVHSMNRHRFQNYFSNWRKSRGHREKSNIRQKTFFFLQNFIFLSIHLRLHSIHYMHGPTNSLKEEKLTECMKTYFILTKRYDLQESNNHLAQFMLPIRASRV